MPFGEAALEALAGHVGAALAVRPLRAPQAGEHEPAFTTNAVQPLVQQKLQELGIPGLIRSGDGAARVRTVNCLGLPFFPDLAISYFQQPLLAVEVKYLRASGRQNSIATSIGQSVVYRLLGYQVVFVFLVDIANLVADEEVLDSSRAVFSPSGLRLVLRRKFGEVLTPALVPGD